MACWWKCYWFYAGFGYRRLLLRAEWASTSSRWDEATSPISLCRPWTPTLRYNHLGKCRSTDLCERGMYDGDMKAMADIRRTLGTDRSHWSRTRVVVSMIRSRSMSRESLRHGWCSGVGGSCRSASQSLVRSP